MLDTLLSLCYRLFLYLRFVFHKQDSLSVLCVYPLQVSVDGDLALHKLLHH